MSNEEEEEEEILTSKSAMAKFGIEYLFVVILFCLVVVSLGEGEGKEGGEIVEIKNGSSIIQSKGEGKLKGEDDWAQISIWYLGQGAPEYLSISGASLGYGKWVPGWGDYSTEIGSPNGKTVYPGGELRIAAAGRSWSPSGTDGSFDIYYSDPQYQYKVAHITFDACYGCEYSDYSIQEFLTDYFHITGQVIPGGTHLIATFYVTWIYNTISAS